MLLEAIAVVRHLHLPPLPPRSPVLVGGVRRSRRRLLLLHRSGMYHTVRHQVALLAKPLAARGARERALSGVDAHVPAHVALLAELLVALSALVRLLA